MLCCRWYQYRRYERLDCRSSLGLYACLPNMYLADDFSIVTHTYAVPQGLPQLMTTILADFYEAIVKMDCSWNYHLGYFIAHLRACRTRGPRTCEDRSQRIQRLVHVGRLSINLYDGHFARKWFVVFVNGSCNMSIARTTLSIR